MSTWVTGKKILSKRYYQTLKSFIKLKFGKKF